jgi:thioredoxin reductase
MEFREIGRRQAAHYGVEFVDGEAKSVCRCGKAASDFEVQVEGRPPITARKLLLATGVKDRLPELENIHEFYGTTVHHCPYCDGWEHRGERVVSAGRGSQAVGLALSLRTWSDKVTACTCGEVIDESDIRRLRRNNIAVRLEPLLRLEGQSGQLTRLHFEGGPSLECDALFFCSEQAQRSKLPLMLGCRCDDHGLIQTKKKQGTGVRGLFLAGDADGDVQLAIVAAAEGAVAATAINRELQDEDRGDAQAPASKRKPHRTARQK